MVTLHSLFSLGATDEGKDTLRYPPTPVPFVSAWQPFGFFTCTLSPRMERKRQRRAFDVPGDAHELTFSTDRRLPLLSKPAARDLFITCLEKARGKHGFRVIAYVVMPNHVHPLVLPDGKVVREILTAV